MFEVLELLFLFFVRTIFILNYNVGGAFITFEWPSKEAFFKLLAPSMILIIKQLSYRVNCRLVWTLLLDSSLICIWVFHCLANCRALVFEHHFLGLLV